MRLNVVATENVHRELVVHTQFGVFGMRLSAKVAQSKVPAFRRERQRPQPLAEISTEQKPNR